MVSAPFLRRGNQAGALEGQFENALETSEHFKKSRWFWPLVISPDRILIPKLNKSTCCAGDSEFLAVKIYPIKSEW